MKTRLFVMLTVLVACAVFAFAGETARDGRFIAYDNGTVLDTKTKLMWAARDNGRKIYVQDARSYCNNYRGGGYTDWRMPTLNELSELYDDSIVGEYGHHLTKLIKLTSCCVWASDERPRGDLGAHLSFTNGIRFETVKNFPRALPVRSNK